MTVLVIDRPFRFATVELEEAGATREASFWSAIRQMDATNIAIFDVIAVARPDGR